ncbi:MAG TPA: class D beta-lactamase [Anaerolineaceae bacterium]|nr:class D beta-lactamase [Anaerolineaceae bacterium]
MALKKLILSLLALLLVGCSAPAFQPVTLSTPTATPPPVSVEGPDLAGYFQGFTGAFVLYDRGRDQTYRYNQQRCAEQLLPASTFKILNALIGLETGVIPDENYVIHWDGTRYPNPVWNQDHTLKTALQNSVVWYYQELARRVGREKMKHYVQAAGYGNQDISGKIDSFWLDGGLRISADEQVAFLKRLYQDDLPLSKRSMQIVRDMLVLEKTGDYRLSGKTGSGQMSGNSIGWFVGYVEAQENVFFFATNIASASDEAQGVKAKEITHQILQSLELLP